MAINVSMKPIPLDMRVEVNKNIMGEYNKGALLVNMVIESGEPLPLEEAAKKLDATIPAVYSTLRRINKSYPQFKCFMLNKKVHLKLSDEIINKIDNRKHGEYSYTELVLNVLKANPDGISAQSIAKELNIIVKKVYSPINEIRKKYHVKFDGDVYILGHKLENEIKKEPSLLPPRVNQLSENNNQVTNFDIIPRSYLPLVENLGETDKRDIADMLKKAYYYRKSAMALIEAANITAKMFDTI